MKFLFYLISLLMRKIQNKNRLIVVSFLLTLVFSLGAIYLLRKNVDYTLGSSKLVEFTTNVETTSDLVRNSAEKLDKLSEVKVLENNLYQVYLNKDLTDDQIKEEYTTMTESGTLIDIYAAESVVETGLGGRIVYSIIWLTVGFVLLALLYRSKLNKLQKMMLIDLSLVRVFAVLVISFGVVFLGTLTGMYLISSWIVNLITGFALLSFVLKVVEYIYFVEVEEDIEEKIHEKRYLDFLQEFFSKKLLVSLVILSILMMGMFLTTELPYIFGIGATVLFAVCESFITIFVTPVIYSDIYKKVSKLKYFEKSRFWTR